MWQALTKFTLSNQAHCGHSLSANQLDRNLPCQWKLRGFSRLHERLTEWARLRALPGTYKHRRKDEVLSTPQANERPCILSVRNAPFAINSKST
jgi:hypothetical protein